MRHADGTSAMGESLRASPLVGYAVAQASGMSMTDWASLAALIYSICLIVEKLYTWRQRWLAKRRAG